MGINSAAIFGAGYWGRNWISYLKAEGYTVNWIADNNASVLDKYIDGIEIVSPQRLYNITGGKTKIFVSVVNDNNVIIDQLCDLGFDRALIYTRTDFYELLLKEQFTDSLFNNLNNVNRNMTSRIRLLYDCQPFSIQKTGGVSRYYYELIKRISRKDEFDTVFLRGAMISEMHSELSEIQGNYKGRIIDDGMLMDYYIRKQVNSEMLTNYCKNDRTVDIYHPGYYFDNSAFYYKKKVVTVYDMIHELYGIDAENVNEKERSIKSADGIITISENTKKDLVNIYNIPEDRIKVIYLGCTEFPAARKGRIVSEPYILFVGQRRDYKNFDVFLYGYARSMAVRHVKLVCFGGGGFNKTELEMIRRLGIEEYVSQIDGDDTDLANAYKNAEIFVYPSKYEGFGLPILEAMEFETPVIAANTSSIPEVAGDAVAYFSPNSAEELSQLIDELMSDSDYRNTLIKKGKERCKMFTWDDCATKTFEFYKEILHR